MNLFYAPEAENYKFLNETESRHCINSLRHKKGDTIHLFDGKGTIFKANIVNESPKKTQFDIIHQAKKDKKHNYTINLFFAPTKNISRTEWIVEKATEMGVNVLSPVVCANSERQILKIERLKKIALSAAKQSINPYIPEIKELTFFESAITSAQGQKLIAHCKEGDKKTIIKAIQKHGHYSILIGPEGDFTYDEITLAKNRGFQEISLGEYRLRTETAAILSISMIFLDHL